MIFVDSSFFIAELLLRDGRHREATEQARGIASMRLLTSNLVMAETWTYLRRRGSHGWAMAWLDAILGRALIRIERIDSELEDEAWAWLRVHNERPYSFVDATSFMLMRRRRVTDALAFDGDFAAAGFNELRA